MKAQRLFVAVLAVTLAGCETPTDPKKQPIVAARIVAGPAEGSVQNETVDINTCIPFRGQVSEDGKVIQNATMEWYDGTAKVATGESPCISFTSGGSHTVELRANGAKATVSFYIPTDFETVEGEIDNCRTFVYDREALEKSCFVFKVKRNTRDLDVKLKGWRYDNAPAAFVDGRLNVSSPLTLGNRILVAEWEVVGRASGEAACTLEVKATPSLQLNVIPVEPRGSGSSAGMMAYAFENGEPTPVDSAVIGGNGKASLTSLAFLDKFEVHVKDQTGRYHRAIVKVNPWEVDFSKEFTILLIPTVWNIADGGHAGKSVPISMNLAFTRHDETDSYSSFYNREWAADRNEWVYRTAIWQKSDRPMKTAFCTDATYTEQDSTIFWVNMKSAMFWYGLDLYSSATCSELEGDRVVRVDIKTDDGVNKGGSISDESGNLFIGIMNFTASSHLNERSVSHEATHVAGVYHTCEWDTVVYSGCNDKVIPTNSPSTHDVAYVQAFYRFGDLKRELGLSYDPIVAALRGERFSKGLPQDFPPPGQ